jgi:AcrR family transcriptional regulator
MSGSARIEERDRRRARHEATRAEIVTAAWGLARDAGLAGITMRDLGDRVGMRAQSLYSYFGSKHDLYDALFEQGYRDFAAWMEAADLGDRRSTPRTRARRLAQRYFEFCVTDPVRFQLLFQRTIPGFVPSPRSYGLAVELLERLRAHTADLGVEDPRFVDLWTATLTGLASQQIANDPDGNRWGLLIDDAVDMLLAHTTRTRSIP